MENKKYYKDESKVLKVEELDGVSGGGGIDTGCEHEWEFIRRAKGVIWGYNNIYECKRCGEVWIEYVEYMNQ